VTQGYSPPAVPNTVTYSRKVFIPLTRLCRDRCHDCTFATSPAKVPAPYLSIDDVVDIARRGAALGCKEALFTLGDRPEARWPQASEWLDAAGYSSTLDYLRAAAVAVLEETGLLPHLNPGVMSWEELQRLKPVAPSMGMMLETTADIPAHRGSPDKVPATRLRVIEDAGRSNVAFTTGILVGIGETPADRVESVLAIRLLARQYRHVQEVLVQNFRAKPETAMRHSADASIDDYVATIAVTRLLLGPGVRVQAPPNLVDGAAHRLAPKFIGQRAQRVDLGAWKGVEERQRVGVADSSGVALGGPHCCGELRSNQLRWSWLGDGTAALAGLVGDDDLAPGPIRCVEVTAAVGVATLGVDRGV
jgi:FO synthase